MPYKYHKAYLWTDIEKQISGIDDHGTTKKKSEFPESKL